MKITINEPTKTNTKKPFPKLMKSNCNERIVYFIQHKEGIEFFNHNGTQAGSWYYTDWDMDSFEDLPDGFSITLTNGD